MPDALTIRLTRTVLLRGGRSIERGSVMPATRTEGGFVVAHPSGIEGAGAFIPADDAAELVSAVDIVNGLLTGASFTLRGRRFERAGYYNVTHGEGHMTLPVWNDRGREVKIRVKATDRVQVFA